ncbi:biotin-dependent carboxyltransferase family protein [Streptomyces sp. TN58]|uniref:5-oxoprolinase subunit C family protein n=1 Tax=Streptomyces sp. TN58 TaxID=234612 RepID=UPI0009509DDB|nr:biotin-dependent carboxyltransferase family protein [Streptomyces sp. TN58]APU39329.1 allophanate hydrolase [Streptomyces sp. TN58]
MTELLVVRPGALTTVQDLGRPGHAHLGVPRSGALDMAAYGLANRLLGNPPDAAVLETTLDGVSLRTAAPVVVAVTGAPCPVRVSGRPAAWGAPVRLPAGAELEVGRAESGLRSYVAVRGGLAVPPVLGSRSTDLLSGLGPPVMSAGTALPVSPPGPGPVAGADAYGLPGAPSELVLPLRLGPRAQWFSAASLAGLWRSVFRVSPRSNRIGLRTEGGRALVRARAGELASEGMVLGAVQVPPDGLPVVFLADHPVTGGYPVVGVVEPGPALDAAAQARPGTPVRFVRAR